MFFLTIKNFVAFLKKYNFVRFTKKALFFEKRILP